MNFNMYCKEEISVYRNSVSHFLKATDTYVDQALFSKYPKMKAIEQKQKFVNYFCSRAFIFKKDKTIGIYICPLLSIAALHVKISKNKLASISKGFEK